MIGRPAAGAGELIFTVPVELAPPFTRVGLSANEVIFGALRVSEADFVTSPVVADTAAEVSVGTGDVVIVNVADELPLVTETVCGTIA